MTVCGYRFLPERDDIACSLPEGHRGICGVVHSDTLAGLFGQLPPGTAAAAARLLADVIDRRGHMAALATVTGALDAATDPTRGRTPFERLLDELEVVERERDDALLQLDGVWEGFEPRPVEDVAVQGGVV